MFVELPHDIDLTVTGVMSMTFALAPRNLWCGEGQSPHFIQTTCMSILCNSNDLLTALRYLLKNKFVIH